MTDELSRDLKDSAPADLEFATIELANFIWASDATSPFSKPQFDVPEINADVKKYFKTSVRNLKNKSDDASTLILPVLGQAGSGKTHLLRTLYQNAKESRGFFIFLDLSTLTATNDFYQTLAIDAYQALAREIKGEREQVYTLLENVALHAGLSLSDFPEGNPKALEQAPLDAINQIAEKTHRGLFQKYRQKAQETRDLLRALFLLASSDHNVHHVASSVLQGTPALDGVDCGFSFNQKLNHLDIFARLTWLMSLNGSFTVLAIDQMDTIVGNYQNMRPPDGAPKSAEIIEHENIIRDLSVKMCEIVRHSVKTFTVASTISDAWETLKRFGLHSSIDRFYEPLRLSPITDEGLLAKIVAQRMADAAERAGHKLPYPTWPFPPAFMKACAGSFPREVMMECAKHISYCRKLGRAKQWGEPDEPGVNPPDGDVTRPPITLPIQARYQELLQRKINPQWKNEKEEASFWRPALNAFIEAFSASLSLSDPASSLEINPAENRKDGLVCAQLRATRESQTHELSLVAILKTNSVAFSSRLNKALQRSGVDLNISWRKLRAIRFAPLPKGEKTLALIDSARRDGAVFVTPTDGDLLALAALADLSEEYPRDFKLWAQCFKPTAPLAFLDKERQWLLEPLLQNSPAVFGTVQPIVDPPPTSPTPIAHPQPDPTPPPPAPPTPTAPSGPDPRTSPPPQQPPTSPTPITPPRPTPPTPRGDDDGSDDSKKTLFVGHRTLFDGSLDEEVGLYYENIRKHVAILGGSGSGKTVLLRRIVEEAALAGAPSLVFDCAGDLTQLGQAWAAEPPQWLEGDRAKAQKYLAATEVVVWTPGRSNGNPFSFPLIPDLRESAGENGDPEDFLDLENQIAFASDNLRAAMGVAKFKQEKSAALAVALRAMAHGDGEITVPGLIRRLKILAASDEGDYPQELFEGARKVASDLELAAFRDQSLRDAKFNRVEELFLSPSGKTRVSVISLSTIESPLRQQIAARSILNSVFSFMKNHNPKYLNGLIVIDEAKELAPSVRSTPSKEVIIRLATMARKYGYGLIVASQDVTSVDNRVINNCDVLFVGKLSAPNAISTARAILQSPNADLPRLGAGEFFLKTSMAGFRDPRKIRAPFCLSSHPPTPPNETEILALARASRPATPAGD